MKPEELMLGDWVNFLIDIEGGDTEYDQEVAQYQPMRIVSLTYWSNNDGEVESAEGVINGIDQVKPISLTPEILEKNFPKEDFVCWEDNKGCELYHIHIERCFQEFNGFLKYVHELQHALILCGIDKEIEI